MNNGSCIVSGQLGELVGNLKEKSHNFENSLIHREVQSRGMRKMWVASDRLWVAFKASSKATSATMGGGDHK